MASTAMKMPSSILVRLPSGRTRVLSPSSDLLAQLESLEGLPRAHVRLVGDGGYREVRFRLLGGGGDQPDWTEKGMISMGGKRRGPEARAPDWHADPAKYAAKVERDKRERGELVLALGPFCVPCGKRFAKQSVYDAHLSGKKHLTALQRMGRDEEAMVCQLDIEAKRRRLDAAEQAKHEAWKKDTMTGASAEESAENAEAAAARRVARDAALRQRAMLPMPSSVAATTVYEDGSSSADAAADAVAEAGGSSGSGGSSGEGGGSSAETAGVPATEAPTDDEEDATEPAAAAAPPPPSPPHAGAFEPSATWQGARAGFVFKRGSLGVGYYEEPAAGGALDGDECEAATP